jgi:heat shock protein beta
LVADRVTVVSKSNDDDQYIWESNSNSDFRIVKDPRGNTLHRGTEIILHLKPDQASFEDQYKLQNLIHKYSEFVNFPVYLWTVETKYDGPMDGPPIMPDSKPDAESDDEIEVEDEEKPPAPPVPKRVGSWKIVNQNKPIWTLNPSDLTLEAYNDFYKSYYKDMNEPAAHIHFKGEGDSEFKCLIFLPKKISEFETKKSSGNIQLFIRKVFITDNLPDFLPSWLNFVKVIIDSDSLPLSIARETIQKHPSVKIIRKRVLAKSLELLTNIGDSEDVSKYREVYNTYQITLKYGYMSEYGQKTKKRLAQLLRFESSLSNFTSIAAYVSRMKKDQPQIYYIVSSSLAVAKASPYVESVLKRGFEVLYLVDPIDEYITQRGLDKFQSIPLQNVASSGLKFGDEESRADKDNLLNEKFKPLLEWLKKSLEKKAVDVKISRQLSSTACSVMPAPDGVSASQEKVIKMQMLDQRGNTESARSYISKKRVLEINPVICFLN